MPDFRNRINVVTQDSGAVLVAGGMMEKMPDTEVKHQEFQDADKLGIGDSLVDASFRHNKELWFALPTTAKFANLSAERMKYDLGRTNVILGNDEELHAIFGGNNRKETLERLRDHMFEFGLHSKGNWSRDHSPSGHYNYSGPTDQVAYISCGKDGADIVTKDDIYHIKELPLQEGPKYKLGAGDAGFAGFLFGWMHRDELGYNEEPEIALRRCGDMAMALASETIKVPQARVYCVMWHRNCLNHVNAGRQSTAELPRRHL